ncbi:MAG TPA: HlyD family type I secretion periplasmic adaptor subunit [Campylobacterales bacterium]|nr:HlyD family type I secretion periplasmic adaptor subunit [Campylobacterales bacterium]
MNNIDDKDRFKPHLVEIEDRPVSPLGRKIMWTILIFMALAVLWLFWGKTDVVVSSRAKVIPMGDIKVLQPLSTGSVKKIYIKEGDFIKKGDPLIEIDPTVEESNIEAKKSTLALLELETAKIKSLINNKPFTIPTNTPPGIVIMIQGMYQNERESIIEQKRHIDQQVKQLDEQIKATQINRDRIQELYRLGRQDQNRLKEVLDIIAKNEYYQVQKQNMNYKSEVTRLSYDISRLQEQIHEITMKKLLIEQDAKNKFYAQLTQKEKEIMAYRSEIDMIEYRKKKQVIVSPVDGIVGKIAINTVGAVVTPAEKLITIVPKEVPLQLKATVENKDIGFIKVGMKVAIKIDTYSFQRFGLIDGVVTKIGANAIEDKKLGLIYEVFIEPQKISLIVEGEERFLRPGMSATAELKVGQRRIIELFVYPLIKYFNEGVSVR